MSYLPCISPVVSDATKLGLAKTCAPALTGEDLYELLHQLVYSTDWPDETGWSKVDSGGKVNLADGVWSMDGNGAWNANGIYKTAGVTAAVGYFEVKVRGLATLVYDHFALNSAAALSVSYTASAHVFLNYGVASTGYITNYNAGVNLSPIPRTNDTWYTLRYYLLKNALGVLNTVRITIQGGSDYPNETTLVTFAAAPAAFASTVYPLLQRYSSAGAALSQFKEFRWYAGYSSGATLTYTWDAGSGKVFSGVNFTSLAYAAGFDSTNLRFKYRYHDGAGSLNDNWLTLAELNAIGALGGSHRYLEIVVQVLTDGATQQYATFPNASDAIGYIQGGRGLSVPDPLDDASIIARVSPGESVEMVGGLQFPVSGTVNFDLDVERLDTGTGTWSKVADVKATSAVPVTAGSYDSLDNFINPPGGPSQPTKWTTPAGEYIYRWHLYITGDVTKDVITYFCTSSGGAPNASFDVRLSASVVGKSEAVAVTGGVTIDQTSAGVTVTLKRYKKTDDSLVETLVNKSVDFTATVQKTWAQIAEAALSFTPTIAQEEYLVATVAGGTPTVTSETSQRFPYIVRPDAPTVVPTDAHTGAVSVAVAGDAGATHYLYRKGFSDTTWTYIGTRAGDGNIADTVTLERWYEYLDFVDIGGARSMANAPVPLFATANTSREGTILSAVVELIRALNWTGWTTTQIDRYLGADKSLLANLPRCAVCPGITPPEIQTLCNLSDTHVYPVRIWLVNRLAAPYNDTLVIKAEQLKGLFRQKQVLNGITGVYDVLVRPLPVAAVPDVEESAHVTGLDLLVLAEEDRQ